MWRNDKGNNALGNIFVLPSRVSNPIALLRLAQIPGIYDTQHEYVDKIIVASIKSYFEQTVSENLNPEVSWMLTPF